MKHVSDRGLWYCEINNLSYRWFVEIYHPFMIKNHKPHINTIILSALTGLFIQYNKEIISFEILIFGFGFGLSRESKK